MAFALKDISTGALTKAGFFTIHHTADVTATVEGAGYYNTLAVNSIIPAVGVIIHVDAAGKITMYGYTHDGATAGASAVVTLNTANALIPIP